MAIPETDIARVLDGARRRQGGVVLATAVAAGLAGVLLALLAGAALLGAGAGPATGIRLAALALAGLAALAALGWAAVALMRRASTSGAVARTVGEGAPELKSDLLSAVELQEAYPEIAASGRYSVALVDAHLARTGERARALDLRRVVPDTPARRALLFLAGAVGLHLLALAVAPRALPAGWRRLAAFNAPEPVRLAEPITGDVELTYVYPAYMRREPRTISGTGGEVSAPRGTEVKLRARADRQVERAELALSADAGAAPVAQAAAPAGTPATPPRRLLALQVAANGRDLQGGFTVDQPGSYRFRFAKGRKVVAEGPPLPIAVEPDAAPEVRITAPAEEVEVDAKARLQVEWSAQDDVGLEELTLVVKPPEAEERRTVLRRLEGARQASGVAPLDLTPFRLAEGEKLLYWLEATDGDTVSGPKRAASATHAVKVYSEAEHHRAALARVQALWEDLVRLLGDRLELADRLPAAPAARWGGDALPQAQALDRRTRELHEGLRAAARELRQDPAAPRELWGALANVAGLLRPIEESLTAAREGLARVLRLQGAPGALVGRVADLDGQLDRELEKGVLYLEQLLDRQRAEDLVRLARDLAARRRDLAGLLERYRQAPTEQGKQELLAEVARLRSRMQDMLKRMAELAKGMNEEHLNQEALAELMKSKDALGGLDEVQKKLAAGDVEGAMKALDQLGNAMQEMLAGLERTAGRPGEQNAALMKDMLAFKDQLQQVQQAQEALARDTEELKAAYRQRVAQQLKRLDEMAKRLEGLAATSRRELAQAERGVGVRSEDDYAAARDRMADVERALQAKDFDAALETARRALPSLQRLALGLADDAVIGERYRALQSKDPKETREAERHALAALDPARKVKEELERLFPDPRSVLGPKEQQRMGELAQRQSALEKRAGELRQRMAELAQRAPVFPPQAGDALSGSQGHMQRATGELAARNPQRGHGEQRQALDDLERFRKGMEEMARRSQQGGGGFPLPFGGEEQGGSEGDGMQASHEKVEIPGADQYKVPDEFRKDLLDAMRQRSPEAYRGEVQRYYEELVK